MISLYITYHAIAFLRLSIEIYFLVTTIITTTTAITTTNNPAIIVNDINYLLYFSFIIQQNLRFLI